jgi:hypothetical protein
MKNYELRIKINKTFHILPFGELEGQIINKNLTYCQNWGDRRALKNKLK